MEVDPRMAMISRLKDTIDALEERMVKALGLELAPDRTRAEHITRPDMQRGRSDQIDQGAM